MEFVMSKPQRTRSLRHIAVCILLLCAAPAVAQQAERLPPRWHESTTISFPYVSLYTCSNQIKRYFPNTWPAIESQIEAAALNWFVEGGANVRLYYRGSLADTHPACAEVPEQYRFHAWGSPSGPEPPEGSVVVTASRSRQATMFRGFFEHRNAPRLPGQCSPTSTDLWLDPPSNDVQFRRITRARITLAANNICQPGAPVYPWPEMATLANTPPPNTKYFHPHTVLMREFGLALGLPQETAEPSVRGLIFAGNNDTHLHRADGEQLRTRYGDQDITGLHCHVVLWTPLALARTGTRPE
jgi:hypothetical protein